MGDELILAQCSAQTLWAVKPVLRSNKYLNKHADWEFCSVWIGVRPSPYCTEVPLGLDCVVLVISEQTE